MRSKIKNAIRKLKPYKAPGIRLSMVQFANLLHQVRTCTEPKVWGAGACLLMNLNLSVGSGSDNLRTCTGRFELGAPIKILYI